MEMNHELISKAYEIARQAHEGQTDKAGLAYITHPVHVAEDVDTVELKIIALLHDVLEDSDWTKEELLHNGIPEELVRVVCILTHDETEFPDYMEYIREISKDPMARKVKMADLRHNMDISRIENPGESDYIRLKKYQKAYALLEQSDTD